MVADSFNGASSLGPNILGKYLKNVYMGRKDMLHFSCILGR